MVSSYRWTAAGTKYTKSQSAGGYAGGHVRLIQKKLIMESLASCSRCVPTPRVCLIGVKKRKHRSFAYGLEVTTLRGADPSFHHGMILSKLVTKYTQGGGEASGAVR